MDFKEFSQAILAAPELGAGSSDPAVPLLRQYLATYGYLPDVAAQSESTEFDSRLDEGLKTFQAYYALPLNGLLDAATKAKVTGPRCGFDDSQDLCLVVKNDIKYWFDLSQMPTGIDPTAVQGEVEYAMKQWQSVPVTGLKFFFTPATDEVSADLVLSWAPANSTLDALGAIADADVPSPPTCPTKSNSGRQVRYLLGPYGWKTGGGSLPLYFPILPVSLHELGHILGLGHSGSRNAVMYAYLLEVSHTLLQTADKKALQVLYR
jgi:hypothetical protein